MPLSLQRDATRLSKEDSATRTAPRGPVCSVGCPLPCCVKLVIGSFHADEANQTPRRGHGRESMMQAQRSHEHASPTESECSVETEHGCVLAAATYVRSSCYLECVPAMHSWSMTDRPPKLERARTRCARAWLRLIPEPHNACAVRALLLLPSGSRFHPCAHDRTRSSAAASSAPSQPVSGCITCTDRSSCRRTLRR